MSRVVLGFLIAPLVCGLLQCAVFYSVIPLRTLIIVYPMIGVLGVPGYFLLRHMGWLTLWRTLASGALLGLLFGVSLVALETGVLDFKNPTLISVLGYFSLKGLFIAGVFWLIALWKPAIALPRAG